MLITRLWAVVGQALSVTLFLRCLSFSVLGYSYPSFGIKATYGDPPLLTDGQMQEYIIMMAQGPPRYLPSLNTPHCILDKACSSTMGRLEYHHGPCGCDIYRSLTGCNNVCSQCSSLGSEGRGRWGNSFIADKLKSDASIKFAYFYPFYFDLWIIYFDRFKKEWLTNGYDNEQKLEDAYQSKVLTKEEGIALLGVHVRDRKEPSKPSAKDLEFLNEMYQDK